MAEVHTIEFIWRPAKGFTPGRALPIRTVILHSSCGREQGDLATLTGPKVSSHWYITRDGKVYHLVQNADTAWHAGRVTASRYSNAASLGIEQEHFDPDDNHPDGENWPRQQVEQAARLCAFLLKQYGLSPDDIHSHAEVAAPPGRKVDPVAYPWDSFRRLLDQKLAFDWKAVQVTG
jgi:N-acetyl-anhydromuramyl-L-alanine amidase AmpD